MDNRVVCACFTHVYTAWRNKQGNDKILLFLVLVLALVLTSCMYPALVLGLVLGLVLIRNSQMCTRLKMFQAHKLIIGFEKHALLYTWS